jgi:hypothetical protein
MNLFHRIVLFATLPVLYSCQGSKEKSSQQEHVIMEEIFPVLIDSMWVEITYSMMPPPVRELYDSNSQQKTFEPIEKGQDFRNEIVEELSNNNETDQVTIVLSDTIHKINIEEFSQLRKHFQLTDPGGMNEMDNSEYKIDFSKHKAGKMFKLVYASEYKLKEHDVSRERILSRISFSRIFFDKAKTVGVLTCEYICGGLCGNGYRVFIKKINDKWIIDKVEETWIA